MDFNQALNYLKEKYKVVLEFEKKRIFPDNNFIADYHNKVYELANQGDDKAEALYNLFRSFIKKSINESILVMKAAN